MNWIEELQSKDFKGSKSQFGEDEIISFIFSNIFPSNRFFCDIGAGFYGKGQMSNTKVLSDNGWHGLRIDANNDDDPTIERLYVTPENIVPFLKSKSVPYGFDFLTIDIDSFDLDILEAVVPEYRPSVICTEFNSALDPEKSLKLKYEKDYVWDETAKYGYSFGAAVKFCNKHGYVIILNHVEQNLFLVRNDLITEDLPIISSKQTNYHPWNDKAEWEEYV